MYEYMATVERVVDGDTLYLTVDVGFRIRSTDSFRLHGVDTPEVFGVKKGSVEYEAGKEATQFVKDWLEENADDEGRLLVRTHKETGKYGRWIAEVYTVNGEKSLQQALLVSGHAEAYGT